MCSKERHKSCLACVLVHLSRYSASNGKVFSDEEARSRVLEVPDCFTGYRSAFLGFRNESGDMY